MSNDNKILSPDELTLMVNQRNVNSVRAMIEKKKGSTPYYANEDTVLGVLTDMDTFPYKRFFRGVSYYPEPIVMEREAGWREVKNNCYNIQGCDTIQTPYPQHCFQSSCDITYPCNPKYLKKYTDAQLLHTILNDQCIVEYR